MDTAINGFGTPLIPTTNYTQTLVVGSQLPANGPQPPPATIPAAISDSNIKDTFTPSQAASVLISAAASTASDSTPLQQFEEDQPPPPYTLQNLTRDANRTDTQVNPQHPYEPFQLRQFSKLVNTLKASRRPCCRTFYSPPETASGGFHVKFASVSRNNNSWPSSGSGLRTRVAVTL